MTQNTVVYSDNPSGVELLDDYLDKDQENYLTSHSGVQRPTYAKAGTVWIDTSVTPWARKVFDGADDIIEGYIDPTTNIYTPVTPLTNTGDLFALGADGNPTRIASGTSGYALISNGPDVLPTYQKIDAFPDQTGKAGKVLTTNGTTVSWEEGLPSQANNARKVLTTNGTTASWEMRSFHDLVASLPSSPDEETYYYIPE